MRCKKTPGIRSIGNDESVPGADGPHQAGDEVKGKIGTDLSQAGVGGQPVSNIDLFVIFAVAGEIHQQDVVFVYGFRQVLKLVYDGALSSLFVEQGEQVALVKLVLVD